MILSGRSSTRSSGVRSARQGNAKAGTVAVAALALLVGVLVLPGEGSHAEPSKLLAKMSPALERGPDVSSYAPLSIDAIPLETPDAAEARTLDVVPASPAPPRLDVVTRGKLLRGQSLGQALRSQGVSAQAIHLVSREMRGHFDFRRSRPGDAFRLAQDRDGRVLEFRYQDKPDSSLRLVRLTNSYYVAREPLELQPRVENLSGVIRSTLYQAIQDSGENPQLASDFAAIFAWDVDFTRAVHAGDDFHVLYERLFHVDDDGLETYVRPGQILAAQYRGVSKEFSAVYFDDHRGGAGGFYRPDGTAVEKHFLIAPLKYSRISSTYSSSRRHPILKVTRPHHGIDYAAPEGTPIWSVADGTVIHRGWAGGFGNLVKVRHVNGYVSYYAHLSRYVAGLRVGQSVRQKQIIGYVGQTGLATGSHVCFRVAKDGQYVNPMTIPGPAGSPIGGAEWARFTEVRDQLMGRLRIDEEVLVEEAL